MDFYFNAIKALINRLSKQEKIAFFSALVAGLFSHGYALTNNYIYHDATILNGLGNTFGIGRWFLGIAELVHRKCLGNYQLPFFNVGVSIILIALAAMVVTKTLKVKTSFLAMFIGAIMVVYPVVTSSFAYNFTATYYFLSLFLAAYSVCYISERDNLKDYALAGFILSMSVALYQAYFTVAACLAITVVMKEFLKSESETRDIIRKGVKLVIHLALGMVMYLVINKLIMTIFNIPALKYMGADSVGSLSISKIPGQIVQAYLHFFYLKWNGINAALCMWVFIILFLVFAAISVLYKLIRGNIPVVNKVLFIVLVLIFPIAVNLVYLMSTSDVFIVHTLMRYGTAFVLITPAVLIEEDEKILGKLSATVLTVIAVSYLYSNNICYLKMNLVQEEMTSYFAVLQSRITSTEGYYDGMPVVFYGEHDIKDECLMDMNEIYPDTQIVGYEYNAETLINGETWQKYMKYHTGYNPVTMTISPTIANSQEFKDLRVYPDSDCMKVIDGAMVVKFCEY